MRIDAAGEVVDYRIVESVIRVDRRMTYTIDFLRIWIVMDTVNKRQLHPIKMLRNRFIRQKHKILNNFKEEVHPKEIQKLLGKVEGTPEEALISRLALRSMKIYRAPFFPFCP